MDRSDKDQLLRWYGISLLIDRRLVVELEEKVVRAPSLPLATGAQVSLLDNPVRVCLLTRHLHQVATNRASFSEMGLITVLLKRL